MRFMMLVYPGPEAEAGAPPGEALLAAMGSYHEEMLKAGVLLAGEGLRPSRDGALVHFEDGKARVVDGPFTEAKEILGGYTMIEVPSRADAIRWASGMPCPDDHLIELRQVLSPEDFAPIDPTGEHRAKEAELRELSRSRQ